VSNYLAFLTKDVPDAQLADLLLLDQTYRLRKLLFARQCLNARGAHAPNTRSSRKTSQHLPLPKVVPGLLNLQSFHATELSLDDYVDLVIARAFTDYNLLPLHNHFVFRQFQCSVLWPLGEHWNAIDEGDAHVDDALLLPRGTVLIHLILRD
jgi:hypothetical protein